MMAANNWRWKHLKTYQLTHALQIRNWFKIRNTTPMVRSVSDKRDAASNLYQ
uniref:Uncharacterized protein n=1 Tax=Aegilops tauschii subsp. strangulata TaxID=200361 RepID=A0A453HPL5_AEGTS